ncbi:MAG: NUDIX hydrolase [Candidatus Aenigmatarchaeota archaeon]
MDTEPKIGYFSEDLKRELNMGINSMDVLNGHELKFGEREEIEESEHIQPIPSAVITDKNRSRVMLIRKNKMKVSKNSPERDKLLMFVGGHVDEVDRKEKLPKTLENALKREVREEIGLDIRESGEPFLIYMPNDGHIAVCYILQILNRETKYELSSSIERAKVVGIEEIEKNKLDPWSKHILKKISPQ